MKTMKTPTSDQLGRFARALGNELRTARKQRGWTRKQMRAHLAADNADNDDADNDEMSLQTLATYELGTRRISVERLVELCAVLDQPPDQLLRRAITGAFGADHADRVRVDLPTLARTADPRLAHLRRWAAVRVHQCPAALPLVEDLDEHALAALAAIAGTTSDELVHALRDLAGASSHLTA
jgi:transcriptional regulator with XRE-family HTH domain